MIDQQIQNYKIIRLLGEGGMGDVYLAEHISIKRNVAIKVLKPELIKNEEIRLRFKNEASMLAHLQHPNIVGLIDYVESEDGLFLIMEYVDGKGLDEILKSQETLIDIRLAESIMKQILEAFQYAHKNGIVHRDVKPSNILITADNQIKVLDFGIAKIVGDSKHNLTKTGTQIGTVFYMSPEQVKGKELDLRSDIYSIGVTFYELLSGVCPYRGMTTEYEIYDSIVREPLLSLVETLGKEYATFWEIIKKATQKEVENRFQNCQEFIDSFSIESFKIDENSNSQKIEINTTKNEVKPKNTKRLIFGSSILLIVVVVGLIFMNLENESSSESIEEIPVESLPQSESQNVDSEVINNQPEEENSENSIQFDAASIISNFLQAEDNRDFDQIFSFYSTDLKRYWTFKYPSYSKLKKEYTSSWNRTIYSKNTIQDIVKINDFTFDVNIDFEFLQYNHENSKNVNSVLRFVLDQNGKISELFGVN